MEDALFHFLDVNVQSSRNQHHASENIFIVQEIYTAESGKP